MPRVTPDCPRFTLRGPNRPQVAPTGLSGGVWASQGRSRPIWLCSDHFRSFRIWLCQFRKPILFCKYLSPLKSQRNGLVLWIYIWILVFRRKKHFKNMILGSWDVKQIQKVNFLFSCRFLRCSLRSLYYCFLREGFRVPTPFSHPQNLAPHLSRGVNHISNFLALEDTGMVQSDIFQFFRLNISLQKNLAQCLKNRQNFSHFSAF